MARITIMGPSGRQERQLFRHNSLGRHPRNTHQVLDRVVSKEHCHIELVDEDYVLKDLGSLNGTYVNGERVVEIHTLEPGDEITIGSTRIVFEPDERRGEVTFDRLLSVVHDEASALGGDRSRIAHLTALLAVKRSRVRDDLAGLPRVIAATRD